MRRQAGVTPERGRQMTRRKADFRGKLGEADIIGKMRVEILHRAADAPIRADAIIGVAGEPSGADQIGVASQQANREILTQRVDPQPRERLTIPHLGKHLAGDAIDRRVVDTFRIDQLQSRPHVATTLPH